MVSIIKIVQRSGNGALIGTAGGSLGAKFHTSTAMYQHHTVFLGSNLKRESIMENTYQLEISQLAYNLKYHKVLNNPFFDLWEKGGLNFQQMEIFVVNYFEWVKTTPHNIALVFLNTTDIKAKCETVKNLFDEMGYGEPKHAHTAILQDFLETLLSKMKGTSVKLSNEQAKILLPSREIIKKQNEFFGNKDLRISYGTLLAQEFYCTRRIHTWTAFHCKRNK